MGAQYSPTVEVHPTCTEVFGDVSGTVSQNTAIVYNSSLYVTEITMCVQPIYMIIILP